MTTVATTNTETAVAATEAQKLEQKTVSLSDVQKILYGTENVQQGTSGVLGQAALTLNLGMAWDDAGIMARRFFDDPKSWSKSVMAAENRLRQDPEVDGGLFPGLALVP